jgi:predicted metal-dependent hydrolase
LDRDTARKLIERLNLDGERLARRFGLRYRSITAERAGVRSRYGVCYADGAIKIRLRHATTGRPLKYSSLVNTLCHELAHLRHFNHGPRFKAFYFEILDHARALGIYRPGQTPADAPARSCARTAAAQRTADRRAAQPVRVAASRATR